MITTHVLRPSGATTQAPAAAPAPEATTPAPARPLPGLTGCSVLEMLFNRAAPNMTGPELAHLASQSGELAQSIALRAAEVAEGVGLLIADDATTGDAGSETGAFRDNSSLPGLLWHLADVFQQVAGLVGVADEAAFLAKKRGA